MPSSSRTRAAGQPAPEERASGRVRKTDRDRVRDLLAWYRKSARDLPWRRTRDPYRIWISETMLQQTRVAAVLPYYERFLAALPTVHALARAPEARVLGLWSGLGYYTRARNLRRAAQQIVREHGGQLPSDPDELGRLPGIGPYTRGALLSLAFDAPYPVVDGNVERVLARWFRLGSDLRSVAGKRLVWGLAAELLPRRAAADFNQALMELGARVCRPRQPLCDLCPLASSCRARRAGESTRYPERRRRSRPLRVAGASALVVTAGGVFVVRPRAGANRGLYDVPTIELPVASPDAVARRVLRRHVRSLGVEPGRFQSLGEIRHAVMDREYRLRVFRADRRAASDGTSSLTESANGRPLGSWLPRSRWSRAALTARARKAIALLLGEEATAAPQPRGLVERKKSVRKSSVGRKPTRS